ncbi:MAG: hypothetical protein ACYC9O_04380 [Candidatus Latescibacterota bacterium]
MKLIASTLSILFAAVVISVAGAAENPSGNALPVRRALIRGNGTAGPYALGFRFLEGSASIDTAAVNSSGLAVSASDGFSGTLCFSRAIPAGDSAVVMASGVPAWLPGTYRLPKTEAAPDGPALSTDYRAEAARIPKPFPGLTFGGSKTFDVNAGSGREAALNQSLRLNISGKLADDITLNAVISDQNVPISPEGNTRELDELDRVLIELRGKRFRADMGDTDLRREGGRWLSWSRRLSGASLGVNAGGFAFSGSGAVSEGRFMSTSIAPVEGNQGPYRLIASDGNRDISIVPGTERIWINGQQLERGDTGDYTIDYTTGEITFTPRRIIGSDLRIVADYEYTSESYRRTFYSAGTDGALFGGKLKLGVVAAREADDVSRPVLTELDDLTRGALSQAGDSLAVVSGIRPAAGDSTGSYDLLNDRLVFNPRGKGRYNVTFSWVGQDHGSYRYTGGGIYEFAPPEERGPGSGASYEPVGAIPAPVTHGIAGVQLSAEPFPWLKFDTEIVGSSFDRNSLSRRNDSDNGGGAYRAGLALSPVVRAGMPLRLDLSANLRSRGETFQPLDRDRTAEENRRWGLPLLLPSGREEITEYSGGVSLAGGAFTGSGIAVNSGKAEFGAGAVSERSGIAGTFRLDKRGDARLEIHRINRGGVSGLPDEDIGRVLGDFRLNLRDFVPSLHYERERAESGGVQPYGAGWDDLRARLETPETGFVRGELELFRRSELAKHTAWEDSSLARGGSVGLIVGRGVEGSLRAMYARRERLTGSLRNATDQAEFEGSYHPENGRVRLEGSYRAGRLREASKRRNYLYIGGGRGQYRWEDENNDTVRDPDEFIPDEHGSYYLYEETLDDYRPVNTVHAYTRLGLDLFGLPGAGALLRSETTFEINEKSSAPASGVFLLKLWDFRRRGVTASGDSRIQQDLTAPLGEGSLRLRLFRLDSFNGEYVTGEERRNEEEESLRLRLPLRGRADVEVTLSRALRSRFMENSGGGDFRVRSYSGDAGLTLYPGERASFGAGAGAGLDRDRVSGIQSVWWLLEPRCSYRISGRGRADASYALTSVSLEGGAPGARLPHVMARGRKEGVNHDITLTYDHRVTERVNLVASYSGRKFADRAFENFGQVQVRAMF